AKGEPHQRREADAVFGSVCSFEAWPSVPIRIVVGADDRFFPVEFQRTLARDRLRVEADVLPGGHLIALSRPLALAKYLLSVGSNRGAWRMPARWGYIFEPVVLSDHASVCG